MKLRQPDGSWRELDRLEAIALQAHALALHAEELGEQGIALSGALFDAVQGFNQRERERGRPGLF